jgi:hypothetical protein
MPSLFSPRIERSVADLEGSAKLAGLLYKEKRAGGWKCLIPPSRFLPDLLTSQGTLGRMHRSGTLLFRRQGGRLTEPCLRCVHCLTVDGWILLGGNLQGYLAARCRGGLGCLEPPPPQVHHAPTHPALTMEKWRYSIGFVTAQRERVYFQAMNRVEHRAWLNAIEAPHSPPTPTATGQQPAPPCR